MLPTLPSLGDSTPDIPGGSNNEKTFDLTPVTSKPSTLSTPIKKGYYVIAYKLNKEMNGRYHYVVTDHSGIEQFIQHRLEFGSRTYDVKIIERVDDYLEAQSVADMLTIEENFEKGSIPKQFTMNDLIDWLKQRMDIKTFFSRKNFF